MLINKYLNKYRIIIIKSKFHINLYNFNNNYKFFFVLKFCFFFILLINIIIYNQKIKKKIFDINYNFLNIKKKLNLTYKKKLYSKIKIGILCNSIKNGGIERLTTLLIYYLTQKKLFDIYLFTYIKEDNEYIIPQKTKRICIKGGFFNNLIKDLKIKRIDIFIYQFYKENEMKILNNLKNIKIIYYNHSCFLFWIYTHLYKYFSIYNNYKRSKYIISLIPFENDYLFKKWGINSILMNNFISFEYDNVIPSTLSSKTILMIGRGSDKFKRFDLGIKAMKFIISEIPESELIIISNKKGSIFLENLTKSLNLTNNIKYTDYTPYPEIFFKNASLHLFPSISESFGLALAETKIYGIPNILIGLDYISASRGGTVIIYDDNPKTIAKEAIKIIKNDKYRYKLGKEARKSMKVFNNKLILNKWVKLIFAIYNGDEYYQNFRLNNKINESDALNIINNQINLLKIREKLFDNITINSLENLTFFETILKNKKS